jgi:ribulose-bisphosphate carboxylase large chain
LRGRSLTNGGIVVDTIIKPKFGLQPKPFGESCFAFCQMNECIP